MKKCFLFLTVLMLLAGTAAFAEAPAVFCTQPDAALLGGADVSVRAADSRLDALNALFGAGSGTALVTQLELIRGLQGYTDGDVRTGLTLVQPLAQSDLYLLCSAETAAAAGFADLPGLTAYLEEHPYELFILRCFEASHEDYASMLLLDTLSLDSEMTVDDEEKWGYLSEGMFLLVADTARTLELAENGCVVLGALTGERTQEYPDLPCAAECGIPPVPGTWYALISLGADAAGMPAVTPDEAVLRELHLHPVAGEISLETDIDNYVDYMTAEGLFFY